MFNLLREIRTAQREISILGTMPLGLSRSRVQQALLDALRCKDELHIVILCESDTDLFYRSLSTDTVWAQKRVSFTDLRVQKEMVKELDRLWAEEVACFPKEDRTHHRNRLRIVHTYVPVSAYIVRCDKERIFACPVTDRMPDEEDYILFEHEDPNREIMQDYLDSCLDPSRIGKYVASPGAEAVELYDHDKAPRGIYPRASFYDTDFHRYVVWNFVFDRSGNLLIHQRGENAKDNRGMWDKSVGGHVDWRKELSSHETAVREMIEELFEDETNKQHMAWFTESKENIVFLGEWRPEKRGKSPLEEATRYQTEWVYFRVPGQLQINSPRVLPDGTERRLRCLVDEYIVIANARLTKERLDELRNSRFRLVSLAELKTEIDTGRYIDTDGKAHEFIPSPDLQTIMSGKLRDVLEEASQYIKFTFGS